MLEIYSVKKTSYTFADGLGGAMDLYQVIREGAKFPASSFNEEEDAKAYCALMNVGAELLQGIGLNNNDHRLDKFVKADREKMVNPVPKVVEKNPFYQKDRGW